MDEKPKSIWRKSWRGPWGYALGFGLLTSASFVLITAIGLIFNCISEAATMAGAVTGILIVVSVVALVLFLFFRWLFSISWRRILIRLAVFAGLIVLFYAEEDWRGWHAWNQFKKEWEAKGEHFDYQALVPKLVPDDQNFALTPIVYSTYGNILTRDGKQIPLNQRVTNWVNRLKLEPYHLDKYGEQEIFGYTNLNVGSWQKMQLTDLSVWQEYYRNPKNYGFGVEPTMSPFFPPTEMGLPVFSASREIPLPPGAITNDFPVSPLPQTPAADVLLALSKYDSTIDELRAAAKLPQSRFPLDYTQENPAEILLPHLATLKHLMQLLQLRTIAELQSGQSDKALADLKLMLRLENSVRNEPTLISHLVNNVIFQITLQPIYEGLASHRWSETQLRELETELAAMNFVADCKLAMRGEAAFQSAMCDLFRNKPEYLAMFFDEPGCLHDSEPSFGAKLICHAIPTGWIYQNQLNCARSMVKYYIPLANTTDRTFSVKLCRQSKVDLETTLKPRIFHYADSMFLPSLPACALKFAHAQASLDLARTAIALERYRVANGNYPDTLEVLAPKFIAQLPHDVIGGQPLKYRRTDDGQFVLYSIGWNETDDGGVIGIWKTGTLDISKGDWVWRYPAVALPPVGVGTGAIKN